MSSALPHLFAATRQPLGAATFYGLAAALVFAGYAIVFWMGGSDVPEAVRASFRNLVPLAIVTAISRPLIVRYIARLPRWLEFGAHIICGIAFSLLLYWLLMVILAIATGDGVTRFRVQPVFGNPAFMWQLLQGVTFYALVATVTYLRTAPEVPTLLAQVPVVPVETPESKLQRYFIRAGDEIHPVDVSEIVSISGADDYAEVTTISGTHLVRMTLTELEAALDGNNFIRVHRSRIVNVARIGRAEPAGGGRLLVHMENGEMIQASRAGSKLLRDLVI